MTKANAIDRILKLRNLAANNTNTNEKATAAKQAASLMSKYGITENDLKSSGKIAAFDRLVDILGEYSSKHPDLEHNTFGAAKVIQDALTQAKKDLPQGRKAVLLDQISQGLKMAKFVMGNSNRTINDLDGIVDSVLKSYQV